jgi:hypothetical protein
VTSEACIEQIDEGTVAIYLRVPGEQVVLLQALVECHEGIGLVRTLSIRKSLVTVLTTPTMRKTCLELLESLRQEIEWELIPRPREAEEQLYLGYFGKRKGEDAPC